MRDTGEKQGSREAGGHTAKVMSFQMVNAREASLTDRTAEILVSDGFHSDVTIGRPSGRRFLESGDLGEADWDLGERLGYQQVAITQSLIHRVSSVAAGWIYQVVQRAGEQRFLSSAS